MKYMEWLEEYADLPNPTARLEALAKWTNRLYANQVWKQKSGKSKSKLDRKDLTEFRHVLERVIESSQLDISLDPVRVPVRELPMAFAGMVFATPLHSIDWQRLGHEVVDEWSDMMARADAAAEEDVEQFEDFVLALISAWGNARSRKERRPINQALNALLHSYPQWKQLVDSEQARPYAGIEAAAGRTIAAPNDLPRFLRGVARWLEDNKPKLRGDVDKTAQTLRRLGDE